MMGGKLRGSEEPGEISDGVLELGGHAVEEGNRNDGEEMAKDAYVAAAHRGRGCPPPWPPGLPSKLAVPRSTSPNQPPSRSTIVSLANGTIIAGICKFLARNARE